MVLIHEEQKSNKPMLPFMMDMPPARFSRSAHVHAPQYETFYLYGPIGEPELFVELIDYILSMGEGDTCMLRLNGPGGSLMTALAIVNAMDTTKGNVITVIDGEAASAHSLIWFAGHKKYVLTERVMLMIHGYSSINGGHMTRQRESLDATDRLFKALAERYYKPFLTEEEYQNVVKGVDDFRLGSDILVRMKEMNAKKEEVKEEPKAEVKAPAAKTPRKKAEPKPAGTPRRTRTTPQK